MFFLQCLLYCVVIYSKHSRKNIILDPFPTVVDPSDPNELALNPKVSYCVVIYSKHSRKSIILDPFPTVVDPSDPNELALNPQARRIYNCREGIQYNVLPTVFTVYNYTITYFRV
jgi:hypothetical protein